MQQLFQHLNIAVDTELQMPVCKALVDVLHLVDNMSKPHAVDLVHLIMLLYTIVTLKVGHLLELDAIETWL
jgi:hypothetical protein